MRVEEFRIQYDPVEIAELRTRLANTRWPGEIASAGWKFGTEENWLKDICEYWHTSHDWAASVARLNGIPQFRFFTGRWVVHFVHLRAAKDDRPLLLLHGWPGSFLEFERVAPLLVAAGYSLVIPSLPGFGYSPHPGEEGVNQAAMAEVLAALMRELGYGTFFAQGGDIGAGVATALAMQFPDRVRGLHLNYLPRGVEPELEGEPPTEIEQKFLDDSKRWMDESGAYAQVHATRPQTVAYGLNDSPAGLAGWILEKFHAWSDNGGDVLRVLPRDFLLDNLTLYWTTQSIRGSMQVYAERKAAPVKISRGERIVPPLSFARFPGEITRPPRSWVERMYTVARWTDMERGGHFAAAEQPELLSADVIAAFGG